MPRFLRTVILVLILLLFSWAAVRSQERWSEFSSPERLAQAEQSRQKILEGSGVLPLHHEIYAAVGEEAWETTYRDRVATELLKMVVAGTGNPFPTDDETLNWVQGHRTEIHDRLRSLLPTGSQP